MPVPTHSDALLSLLVREERSRLAAAGTTRAIGTGESTDRWVSPLCEIVFLAAVERDALVHVQKAEVPRSEDDLGALEALGRVEVAWRDEDTHDAVVSLGDGAVALLGCRGGACEIVVAARQTAIVAREHARLAAALRSEAVASDKVPLRFWSAGTHCAQSILRSVDAPAWGEIERNYPRPVRAALEGLVAAREPGAGSLILWHGPPGTGKTHAVQALARAWRSWSSVHCVTDPERLLGSPAYLMDVATDPLDDERHHRLVILEDAGELMAASARSEVGQGLSRLLNLTDGLLGQGSAASCSSPPTSRSGACTRLSAGPGAAGRRSTSRRSTPTRRPPGSRCAASSASSGAPRRWPSSTRSPRAASSRRTRARRSASRARSRAERARDVLLRHRAGTEDREAAVALPRPQVDDGRRRAGQRAAVEDEVGGAADALGDRLERARVGAARVVGARLQDRPADAGGGRERLRPRRHAQAERVGVRPAREREAPVRVGQQQRDRAGHERLDRRAGARPELGERRERELGVEEHHRRRLLGPAALEEVQLRDRLAVVGLARQAVDGVGREQGHPADRDAAAERLGVGRRDHRRPTTTRSIPVRS